MFEYTTPKYRYTPLTDVLEGLVELGEVSEHVLHHLRCPVVDLGTGVGVAANHSLDALLDDGAHLIHHKLVLEGREGG